MDSRDQVIDKLLSGYIEHVKISSRTWIALAVLSIYSIAVFTLNPNQDPKLPFVDVSLTQEWFSLVSIGLMAALITRWLEAQSRAVRTRRDLVEPLLKHDDPKLNKLVSEKDLWDARIFIGTATVWSAPAAFIRSSKQWPRYLSVPYLFFLKTVAISVHFGLPGVAIALLLRNWFMQDQTPPKLMTYAVILLALIAALQLFVGIIVELRYSKGTINRMIELLKTTQ